MSYFTPVPEVDKISFSEKEEEVYAFWEKIDAFQTSMKQSEGKPRFTFYDGPPFATGMPHYGHILTGTIKDVVTRWAHQNGHYVERRFGWDTHGLPVEYEIDKTHNISGPEDVAKMGIKHYNDLCRGIITRYSKEWENIVSRLGRWIDFKNDYKTMYPWYMESIWWVFSQLYEKNMVYKGIKVMPFSTACSTPISNFEAGQNYKDVQDPSVVITFPLVEDPDIAMVAWTTTPWTLPANLAICVHPEMDYVKLIGKTKNLSGTYIIMESRICQLFSKEEDYEIIERMKGVQLKGKKYVPLFDYYVKIMPNAFEVIVDEFVTAESGTGLVHQAPYFGEDDYRVSLIHGIITKEQEPVCPVDDVGRMKDPVTHFKGMYIKDADPLIIKYLREHGRLLQSDRVSHNYPYCWRSDTPLIYRAVTSWFIKVESIQERLLTSNDSTYWVPNFVKEKRFANWLKNARDWAVSRNRYWGTPIPLWVSEDLKEIVCIGSIEQLEKLSGEKITDLHRDSIDHITIPSSYKGHPPLKRISEVFDCWFESGSMPYAQVHYPFENKEKFEECFPANFIAEGIDQTRGWFYTLIVLSTALFDKPPFQNLIVNGLVLASDGQKMSKRKKNYPDPIEVVNKYGADALRLYLMNSPSVRGENLRFKEEDVLNLLKEVFIPWLNVYRFFVQQAHRMYKDHSMQFHAKHVSEIRQPENVMDGWILSTVESLIKFIHTEMAAYRLYTVTPRLIKFVDNLTNWYVRFNRKRLKGETSLEDCMDSLQTLYTVLIFMIQIMSPFTPFITEMMYQNLKQAINSDYFSQENIDSIHYLMVPKVVESLIDENIEASVGTLQSVVELGRHVRDKINCPLKYPLPEVIVIINSEQIRNAVQNLKDYIQLELNVKTVTTSGDKEKYGVVLKAELNFKLLGSRLKKDMKAVQQKAATLSEEEIKSLIETGKIEICGHEITTDEVNIKHAFSDSSRITQYEPHSDGSVLILLDTTPSQEMLDEGLAREVTSRVQKLRKKAKLMPTDDVTLWYNVEPADGQMARIASQFSQYIQQTTKTPFKPVDDMPNGLEQIISDNVPVKGSTLHMLITKGSSENFP